MAQPTVRTLDRDELLEASKVVNYGMLGPVLDEVSRGWADLIDPTECHGAFASDGRVVGMTRRFATDLAVPGGEVQAAGITAVAVLSTHRRRGHLTRLMRAQLDDIRDRSIPVAVLMAAEWPIYGRFGYGPAIDACRFEIDAPTASFRESATGSIELVEPASLLPELAAAHERRRARTPGAISREAIVWERLAGVSAWPGQTLEPARQRGAVWRDANGDAQGAVAYKVAETWHRNRPAGSAEVTLLVGATPAAERELWRHLCEVDWVRTVMAGMRGVDDPLPLFLDDARAATALDPSDALWARILDVPAAFAAHRPARAGSAVVEVSDPMGYAAGRWRIELAPDGAAVEPSTAAVDVALPVEALGALYLGGRSAARLHEAGWLEEGAAHGVERLDALLATPTRPWLPTAF